MEFLYSSHILSQNHKELIGYEAICFTVTTQWQRYFAGLWNQAVDIKADERLMTLRRKRRYDGHYRGENTSSFKCHALVGSTAAHSCTMTVLQFRQDKEVKYRPDYHACYQSGCVLAVTYLQFIICQKQQMMFPTDITHRSQFKNIIAVLITIKPCNTGSFAKLFHWTGVITHSLSRRYFL